MRVSLCPLEPSAGCHGLRLRVENDHPCWCLACGVQRSPCRSSGHLATRRVCVFRSAKILRTSGALGAIETSRGSPTTHPRSTQTQGGAGPGGRALPRGRRWPPAARWGEAAWRDEKRHHARAAPATAGLRMLAPASRPWRSSRSRAGVLAQRAPRRAQSELLVHWPPRMRNPRRVQHVAFEAARLEVVAGTCLHQLSPLPSPRAQPRWLLCRASSPSNASCRRSDLATGPPTRPPAQRAKCSASACISA